MSMAYDVINMILFTSKFNSSACATNHTDTRAGLSELPHTVKQRPGVGGVYRSVVAHGSIIVTSDVTWHINVFEVMTQNF